MYSVGESVGLYCADTFGSSNLVQWLDSAGTVLASSSTSVTLNINLITDRYNGAEYTCRIHSFGSTRDLNYTIIVLSEFGWLLASMTRTHACTCSHLDLYDQIESIIGLGTSRVVFRGSGSDPPPPPLFAIEIAPQY